MTAFSRKIDDDPDVLPPEFRQLFLQSSLAALGGECRPVCVGMAWTRLITAGSMRQWRRGLREVEREVGLFEGGVPGGVENVGWRARMIHYTGNWLVLKEYLNAKEQRSY